MSLLIALQETLQTGAIWTGAGGAIGAAVVKLYSSEKPYRRALKFQEERIDDLEADRAEWRAYIVTLVTALRKADMDVPSPPESF